MLILTRRTQETVMIGDNVSITVLGTKGNQVRLGVAAPKDVPVHRLEIWERVQEEQQGQPGAELVLFNPCLRVIAQALKQITSTQGDGARRGVALSALAIADALAREYPAFDKHTFLRACDVQTGVPK